MFPGCHPARVQDVQALPTPQHMKLGQRVGNGHAVSTRYTSLAEPCVYPKRCEPRRDQWALTLAIKNSLPLGRLLRTRCFLEHCTARLGRRCANVLDGLSGGRLHVLNDAYRASPMISSSCCMRGAIAATRLPTANPTAPRASGFASSLFQRLCV